MISRAMMRSIVPSSKLSIMRTYVLERSRDKGSPIQTDPIGDRTASADPTLHAMKRIKTCYERILSSLAKGMDENVPYRLHTEAVVKHRLECFEKAATPEQFEKSVGGGSLDQLLHQAENERELVDTMVQSLAYEESDKAENMKAPLNQWKWPPLA